MEKLISICIPTCDRSRYVEDALQSVIEQDPTPYEVLIGDDSSNRKTARLIQQYETEGMPIRHIWNEPSLGQAKNVDRLFQKAEGDFLVLLHDDDRLLDGALIALLTCFEENPDIVAAFGKQQVTDAEGNIKLETTERLNEGYYRTSEYEGRQSSMRSAVVQQFPNDGYMVRAEAAKKVGYDHGAGNGCDFAFGVALSEATDGPFYFTDTFTAQYRLSEQSVGRGNSDSGYQAVRIVMKDLPNDILKDPHIKKWLKLRLPAAIIQAAEHGYPKDGLRWFFSSYHRHQIATLGGARRLLRLISSFISPS